jgi:hypothetical protein
MVCLLGPCEGDALGPPRLWIFSLQIKRARARSLSLSSIILCMLRRARAGGGGVERVTSRIIIVYALDFLFIHFLVYFFFNEGLGCKCDGVCAGVV